MPHIYKEVPAELFLESGDVCIYRVYRNDEVNRGPREYWFTTEEYSNPEQGGDYSFDVRDLPNWEANEGKIMETIIDAINQGLLKQEGLCEEQTHDQ